MRNIYTFFFRDGTKKFINKDTAEKEFNKLLSQYFQRKLDVFSPGISSNFYFTPNFGWLKASSKDFRNKNGVRKAELVKKLSTGEWNSVSVNVTEKDKLNITKKVEYVEFLGLVEVVSISYLEWFATSPSEENNVGNWKAVATEIFKSTNVGTAVDAFIERLESENPYNLSSQKPARWEELEKFEIH